METISKRNQQKKKKKEIRRNFNQFVQESTNPSEFHRLVKVGNFKASRESTTDLPIKTW